MIVGSGVSGIAAALRFADKGVRPCLVDVGLEPTEGKTIHENLYSYRENHDIFAMMIGYQLLGILGIILAVPIATSIGIFISDYSHREK